MRSSSPSSLEPIATDINDDPGRRFFAIFAFTCQLLLGYHCHQGRFSPLHLLFLKIYIYITDICCVLNSPHPCVQPCLEFWKIKTFNFWLQICPFFGAKHHRDHPHWDFWCSCCIKQGQSRLEVANSQSLKLFFYLSNYITIHVLNSSFVNTWTLRGLLNSTQRELIKKFFCFMINPFTFYNPFTFMQKILLKNTPLIWKPPWIEFGVDC